MDNNLAVYDAQKLEVKNIVCLYTITLSSNIVLNLTPHSNSSQIENLKVGNTTFISIPIEMQDVEYSSSGALNRPTISIGNIEGAFSDVNFGSSTVYDFIIGGKVTKRTTFEKFVDKFNTDFPAGDLESLENNLIILRKEKFIIDRVTNKNIIGVTFELASPYDLHTVKVPGKVIYSGHCPYLYKGARNYVTEPNNSVGGCTWNNQVSTNLSNSQIVANIFMNRYDEYIVRFNEDNFITPIPISETGDETDVSNESIKKGHYYYQENSTKLTQISSSGSLVQNQTVNDYWQALYDIDETEVRFNIHFPNDSSPFWRRIRVYEDYTPNKTFKGYTDKRYNEYVAYRQPDPTNTIPITSTGTTTITSSLGSDFNVNIINITSDIASFSAKEIESIVLYDIDGYRQLSKVQIDSNDPLFGLSKADEFVVVSNVIDADNIEYRIFTLSTQTDFLLDTTFSSTSYGSRDTIYQVAGRSQFYQAATGNLASKSFHQELPSAGSTVWKTGDVCGKALSSCSLRFQGKIVFETPAILAEAENIDLRKIEVPLSSANFESDGEIIISQGYNFLDDTGYVTPYIHNLHRGEFQKLFTSLNTSPGVELIDVESFSNTDLSISPHHGATSFKILNSDLDEKLKTSPVGKLHGQVIGSGNLEYPMTEDETTNYPVATKMQSITFVYEKTSGNKIRLYHVPDLLDITDSIPSIEDTISNGTIVTFSSMSYPLTMRLTFNAPGLQLDASSTISSSHTIDYPIQSIFFNFLNTDVALSEYNNYIATDRATNNVLPFGGYPGTKRFS